MMSEGEGGARDSWKICRRGWVKRTEGGKGGRENIERELTLEENSFYFFEDQWIF